MAVNPLRGTLPLAQLLALAGRNVLRNTTRSALSLAAIAAGVAGLILVMVAVAHAIDERRKRAAEAVRLQAQISDALLCDRTLARLPVIATVHIPVWGRSPARIEMSGQVPTAHLWQAVLQVAEQEASRTLDAFHIDDRIAVVLSERARAA